MSDYTRNCVLDQISYLEYHPASEASRPWDGWYASRDGAQISIWARSNKIDLVSIWGSGVIPNRVISTPTLEDLKSLNLFTDEDLVIIALQMNLT